MFSGLTVLKAGEQIRVSGAKGVNQRCFEVDCNPFIGLWGQVDDFMDFMIVED
ncbi:hypothetical protein D3C75_1382720 [compost metagenome]